MLVAERDAAAGVRGGFEEAAHGQPFSAVEARRPLPAPCRHGDVVEVAHHAPEMLRPFVRQPTLAQRFAQVIQRGDAARGERRMIGVRLKQKEHAVDDALALLDRWRQREAAVDAVGEPVAPRTMVPVQPRSDRLGRGHERRGVDVRMFGEEPADEAARVGEPFGLLTIGDQKQVGVGDPARGEDEQLCVDEKGSAVERGHVQVRDTSAVRIRADFCHVGVAEHAHVRSGDDAPAIQQPEVRRCGNLEQLGDDLRLIQRQARALRGGPGVGVVVVRPEPAHRLGATVVRLQRRAIERPAAVRHPVAPLEIARLERRAAARPAVRRPAEDVLPRLVQREVRQPRALAPRQRLRRAVRLQAAAFHQTHAKRLIDQLERQRDPRGAGADDAHVGVDRRGVGKRARVNQHGFQPR